MFLNTTYLINLIIIPYLIMIICKVKIYNYLKQNQHCLCATFKRVQRDLTRVLLVQAIVPIFFAFLPLGVHSVGSIIDADLLLLSFICGILYSWIPTSNAILILIFVTPYRDKLKQLFPRSKPPTLQLQK